MGTQLVNSPEQITPVREILTENRTYYVRTDGSDSNNGLANTATGAFLTLQHAYDVIVQTLDLGGQTVTIQLADGTYTGALSISKPWIGGSVTIQGNAGTPANVLISTSVDCISNSATLPAILTIKDCKLTTSSGSCILNAGAGIIQYQNVNFGSATSFQIYALGTMAMIACSGNYTISAGALGHCGADAAAQINIVGVTVTISGTPNFTYAFAGASQGAGLVRIHANTFSGSATGTRYNIATNAVIFTNGGGATYLPGNAAGSTATGGQYV